MLRSILNGSAKTGIVMLNSLEMFYFGYSRYSNEFWKADQFLFKLDDGRTFYFVDSRTVDKLCDAITTFTSQEISYLF